jgi:peroxiredoxin
MEPYAQRFSPTPVTRRRAACPAGTPAAVGRGRRRGRLAAAVLLLATAGACGGSGGGATLGPHEGASHPMVGRRAPDFIAQDPSGTWLPLSGLVNKPVVLLLLRTGGPFAAELAREIGRLRDNPDYSPTIFLGIVQDPMPALLRFRDTQKLSLPLLRDPGSIARSYGVGALPTVVLLDADHVIRFQLDGILGSQFRPRMQAVVEALRRLPQSAHPTGSGLDLAYTAHPRAPLFAARGLDGRRVDLAALRGKVVVLNFFDQDCPHCAQDLPRLVPVLREYRRRGVAAIGVTSRDKEGQLRAFLKRHDIDYPVIVDAPRAIFSQYQSTRTPDTYIIDGDGFIRFHEEGDRPDREALTRLQLRLALGRETPAAIAASLPRGRYLGDGACRSCHDREYRDWLLTPHSLAWESLQKGDKWRDETCVGCHVTGRGRPGGYTDPEATAHLRNVQCEVCHGPGGGHPEGKGLDSKAIAAACASCHTGKFVLNFDLDEALALVAHRDHPDLDRLFRYSDLQRQRLEQINTRRLEKFKSGVAHVGADACRDCHQREYDQWGSTKHAAAFAVLLQAGRSADPVCQPCHTTGLGRKGGFGDETATAVMTGVQCEVCHGPGADHVKAPAELKKQTIYGITDQCSFCIIQGVCATCHDQANDPHFDIETALPLVRHLPQTPEKKAR